jgi:hypothetical protein
VRNVMFALAFLATATASQSASASWQLIPGKTYDGHVAVRSYREPCWSAAVSKCFLERSGHKWLPHGHAPGNKDSR